MNVALPSWALLFAREPEPDPDLDDLPSEGMDHGRPGMPPISPPPRRRSGRGPLMLLLALVLVAGATYIYMEPDTVRGVLPESITDLFGEPPSPGPPAMSEQGPAGAPQAPPSPQGPPMPDQMASSPSGVPSPDQLPGEARSPSSPEGGMPPMSPAKPAPGEFAGTLPSHEPPGGAARIPEPRFGEGQFVTVTSDTAGAEPLVRLTADPAGARLGPMVRPGTALRVLDGELQSNVWVYSVRTPEGQQGWLPEKRLQAKRP